MIILACFAAYIVIPFIVYSINDYFAGLWKDRLDTNMSIYYSGESPIIVFGHLLWPLAILIVAGAWVYHLVNYKFGKFNFDVMYNAGEAKRKRDTDLDYQAEKHLLGRKKP